MNSKNNPGNFAPSREFQIKAAVAVFAFVLIVIGIYVYQSRRSDKLASLEDLKASGIDTDKDGLSDWEEALWQTNTRNKDTDGDGTEDGPEVLAKRDPLRPGPNDTVGSDQIVALYRYDNNPDRARAINTNQTKNLADTLLPRVLLLSGKDNLTETDLEDVLLPIENSAALSASISTQFGIDDVNSVENTPNKRLVYSQAVATTMSNYQTMDTDEIADFATYLKNNDTAGVTGMRSTAMRYESLARDLLATPVPGVVANNHLELINKFNSLSGSIERLSGYFEDPIDALIGLKQYKEVAPEIPELLAEIANKLQS